MKFTYYIIKDRSLDKDKAPLSIIAKYNGTRFLAAVPLPRFVKIDDSLFNKAPRIPKKNVEYVLTKQDLNKDGIKDVIISVFNKGKLIVCLPFVNKSIGGMDKKEEDNLDPNMIQDNNNNLIKNQSDFLRGFNEEFGGKIQIFGMLYVGSKIEDAFN